MFTAHNILDLIVSISDLNRGGAAKIISSLSSGPKVVVKNNQPVCVMLSPEQYAAFYDEIIDNELYAEAVQRMAHFDEAKLISSESFEKHSGISNKDLDGIEVELE